MCLYDVEFFTSFCDAVRVQTRCIWEEENMTQGKKKLTSLFAILFLTLLGTSSTAGNLGLEGVNAVDGLEESVVRPFIISEDLGNTEPEADKRKNSLNQFSGLSLDQGQKAAPKGKIIPTGLAGSGSSCFEKAWNDFAGAVRSLHKWLYVGTEWPKDINKDTFSRRTITRAKFTFPADDFVNHSLFDLDITDDMETNSCPVTCSFSLTTLTESNSHVRFEKSRDITSENTEILENQIQSDEKESEPNLARELFVVLIGHYDNEFDKWPELRPEFESVDYYSSHPEILATSPLQREKSDNTFPDSLELRDLKQDDDDYILWSESAPEFATVGFYGGVQRQIASDSYIYTDNAWPERRGRPVMEDNVWEERMYVENQAEGNMGSSSQESLHTGTAAHVLLQETKASATVDVITWPDPVYTVNMEMKPTSNAMASLTNDSLNQEGLICPNHLVDNGYGCMEKDRHGICEAITVGVDRSPRVVPAKVRKDNWLDKTVVNESVMCPLSSSSLDQEIKVCPNKAGKRTSTSTWLITRVWNSGRAFTRWPKSSGVPPRAADVSINVMEVCMAGSNKTGTETKFCAMKALKRRQASPWFVTKLWRSWASYVRWPRKSNDAPAQVTDIPVNVMENCMAEPNKTGPNTNFYNPVKTAKRSSASSLLITRLWRNFVRYLGWRKGVPLLPPVPINIMEVCMAGSNKTGPETKFCAMNVAKRSNTSPWFATWMWNKGVDTVRWIKANETQEKVLDLIYYYWMSFNTTMINWTWQKTIDVMIVIWMIDFCLVALYLITGYIKEISRLLRKQREIRRLEFEEEENERQLLKRELELKRQRAAQPKPIWRPKTPKKKRSNYCGKQQNWN